ncbi:glycosyltransferase family 1 protein [Gilvibacter sp.]|uniref:glycosyltransferase family 4 protein n=1 Tax=Gilvibacter sp. TaxID=2729997 RepID=UPI0025C158B9|nr:glycosyltransferase family 1 protein [Gilvibacter sp.]
MSKLKARSFMPKRIFLEMHNLKNPFTGFGQFNLHLLRGLKACNDPDLKFVVHAQDLKPLKAEFGDFFDYKYYMDLRRYDWAQIRKKYDVWHSVNQNTKVEPKRDLPYVLTIHDVNFIDEISNDLDHPRNLRFKEKLARAKAITYISEFAKESTHQYFEIPKVPEHVILNGNPSGELLDLSNYTPQTAINGDFLFTLGDFWERKNFHLLVEMLSQLPNERLVIAGNDSRAYGDKVRETIKKHGLEDRVILAGRVDDREKQFLLANCKAFLFASLREGFGLPPIEAMKFGKPVFLAHRTSLPEVGGTVAYYWHDLEPKAMAKVFQEGMADFNADPETKSKAFEAQAAKFHWNSAAAQYIEVYKSLI